MTFNSSHGKATAPQDICAHCSQFIRDKAASIEWDFHGEPHVWLSFHPECARDFLLAFARDVYQAQRELKL